MLIFDLHVIGDKLYYIRKRASLTQAEVAEAADLSDRTYAEIERGTVNMRLGTLLKICNALDITPDEILTENNYTLSDREDELMTMLYSCSKKERETALSLLSVYLDSLK
ncbi:MAG: helix-turn-helix transcriptional regulator [Anaerofustis stercorihominis]|nr:helix-turn-helix transcriptional regulator [Anaerofustis stercorihominis]